MDADLCLKYNKEQVTYQLLKGKCLFHLRNYEEAKKWISMVNQSKTVLLEAKLYAARLDMALAQFEKAIEGFKNLLKDVLEKTQKMEVYQYIGSCYLALGENKLAQAHFSLAH